MAQDLRARTAHFEFGDNWLNFVDVVDEARISEATRALQKLFPYGELHGRRFLDIGCGSGLSMLAALRLGAAEVAGFDIDDNSVAAARQLLSRYSKDGRWTVSQGSVFEIASGDRRFDVVYSWGVLHHTGDMWSAIQRASQWVADDGLFALAIYAKTPLCGFWKHEKRIYTHFPAAFQALTRLLFKTAFISAQVIRGHNPMRYIRTYRTRGMSWSHDVHDWLGGYPYESATPDEIQDCLQRLGFATVRENIPTTNRLARLAGSGCNEFVARRIPVSRPR